MHLEQLLALVAMADPIWVVITIVLGLVLGRMSKPLEFEVKTIYILALFYAPVLVVRLIAFFLAGTVAITGSGFLGTLFFILYIIMFIIGRRLP